MTTTAVRRVPHGRYRFAQAARMEWIKLRSLRSTWWALPGGIAAPTLGQRGVLRAVVLSGAGYCLIGLLGLGLGAIIRHTPAAIAVLVGGVYVVAQMVAAFAPAIMPYLPIAIVANSLGVVQPVPIEGRLLFLSPWAGLGMLCLYAAVTLGVGAWLLARRDA